MNGWLRRGAAAASLAGDRADLWPAGTLAHLAYLGWPPLLLAVAPLSASDIQAIGVSLYTSSAYPANVVALGVVAVSGFALLCLLSAVAEVALMDAAVPGQGDGRSVAQRTVSALAVVLIAAIPALAATGLLAVGVAGRAAAEFTSPDLATPVLLRLGLSVLPQLGVLMLAVLLGQVFGGLALHHLLRPDSRGAAEALRVAVRRLARRPWRPLGVAAAGWLKDLLYLALCYALLRVLWEPIGADLGSGLLASPAPLLLVGFVAIWLGLLVAGGALHLAVSAWWALEPSIADRDMAREAGADIQPGLQGGHGR